MASKAATQAINEAFPLDQANALRSAGLTSASATQEGTVLMAAAVGTVTSANAGATYTAAEQTLVNELKTDLNALIASLRAAGVLA